MRRTRNVKLLSPWHKSRILFALALGVFGTALCNPTEAKTARFDAGDFGYTWPMAINASKSIAGYYEEYEDGNYVMHAFLRTPDKTITNIDVDGATCGTFPFSINSSGTVVGLEQDGNCIGHGFMRSSAGTFTTFDAPGAIYTYAGSINDAGVITGLYEHTVGKFQGFRRATDGTITNIDPHNSVDTQSAVISNSGVIAGSFKDKSGIWHCFLRATDGTFTTFDAPSPSTKGIYVTGINDSGEVVGTEYINDQYDTRSFLRQADGTVVEIGPDGMNPWANAINNKGVVIGQYQDEEGVHGFLRRKNGTTKVLDLKTSLDTYPNSINDNGDIAGAFDDETPPHEPGSRGDIFYTHGFGILHKK